MQTVLIIVSCLVFGLLILLVFGLLGKVLKQSFNLVFRLVFMGLGGSLLVVGLAFPFIATDFFTTHLPKTPFDFLAMIAFELIVFLLGGLLLRVGWKGFFEAPPKNRTWITDLNEIYYKNDLRTMKTLLGNLPALDMNHPSLSKKYPDWGKEVVTYFENPDGTQGGWSSATERVPKIDGQIYTTLDETCDQLFKMMTSLKGSESAAFRAEGDDTIRISVMAPDEKGYATRAVIRVTRLPAPQWMLFIHGV